MGNDLQADVKKLEDKSKIKTVMVELKRYMNKYIEADKEYTRIPNWRIFKQMKNIRKREKLNRAFKIRMLELGIFI